MSDHNNLPESKQQLINKEKYELLQKSQQVIYKATESSPSIRKIVNELINEENLQLIQSKFIEIWRD